MTKSLRHPCHVKLLLYSTLAGVLSTGLTLAIGDFVSAVRGALMGLCLSLGIVVINHLGRDSLNAGKPPGEFGAILVGAGSGLLAGALLSLVNYAACYGKSWLNPAFVRLPSVGGIEMLIMGLCYGVMLHLAYAQRWRIDRRKALRTLLWLALAGYLAGCVRGLLTSLTEPRMELGLIWLIGLFSGFPFALFWGAAICIADPAWSLERWSKLTAKAEHSQPG